MGRVTFTSLRRRRLQALAPGVSPKAAAHAVHALVDGLINNWMLDRDAFDLKRVGRSAVLQLLAGLSRRDG